MQPFDDNETVSLEVIDATLAGEAVEPEYAELAELTLILAGQRPLPSAEFGSELDERVARRFAPAPVAGTKHARRWWVFAPGAAIAVAAAAAVAVVISGGGQPAQINGVGGGPVTAGSSSSAASAPARPSRAAANGAAKAAPSAFGAQSTASGSAGAASGSAGAASGSAGAASGSAGAASGSAGAASGSAGAASSSAAPVLSPAPGIPAPSTAGRQVIQSAQLSLSTRPRNVDAVAQQVFDVIAAQNGVVENSQVTATNNASGYAQFQLSVPSANLSQTMGDLSRLHGASVASRTDATQDITGQVGAAGRALADARALRTALLRQLQNATTTTAIDSLKTQIRDAEASISSDLATLNKLHHQVDFSQISLTINAASVLPVHPVASGDSFTLGKAAHDAGRVLVVAAGVALITLAVLVPIAMVVAVVLWIAYAIRRRRREQALDLV
jgi:hypothetical protein